MQTVLTGLESFFCLVHNTADITEASSAERMGRAAVAAALLFGKYPFHDQRAAFVFQNIFCYVVFRISEAVANLLVHGTAPRDLISLYS